MHHTHYHNMKLADINAAIRAMHVTLPDALYCNTPAPTSPALPSGRGCPPSPAREGRVQ